MFMFCYLMFVLLSNIWLLISNVYDYVSILNVFFFTFKCLCLATLISTIFVSMSTVVSRVHATLQPALSVGPSIDP